MCFVLFCNKTNKNWGYLSENFKEIDIFEIQQYEDLNLNVQFSNNDEVIVEMNGIVYPLDTRVEFENTPEKTYVNDTTRLGIMYCYDIAIRCILFFLNYTHSYMKIEIHRIKIPYYRVKVMCKMNVIFFLKSPEIHDKLCFFFPQRLLVGISIIQFQKNPRIAILPR